MIGTANCIYETTCGWCSKWDKKCDKKIPKQEQNIVDDNNKAVPPNKICSSDLDHDWECIGMGTAGSTFRCRKCYTTKTIPPNFKEYLL